MRLMPPSNTTSSRGSEMEAVVSWVQAMLDEGHVAIEYRVNEPWASALRDAGYDPAIIGPAHPGNESKIEFVTDGGSYFAVLSY
jgi:hypothetical protein